MHIKFANPNAIGLFTTSRLAIRSSSSNGTSPHTVTRRCRRWRSVRSKHADEALQGRSLQIPKPTLYIRASTPLCPPRISFGVDIILNLPAGLSCSLAQGMSPLFFRDRTLFSHLLPRNAIISPSYSQNTLII